MFNSAYGFCHKRHYTGPFLQIGSLPSRPLFLVQKECPALLSVANVFTAKDYKNLQKYKNHLLQQV